ncbi:MAG TPA: hypothetical protein VF913_12320 [Xanthobacteraceae bacterium]
MVSEEECAVAKGETIVEDGRVVEGDIAVGMTPAASPMPGHGHGAARRGAAQDRDSGRRDDEFAKHRVLLGSCGSMTRRKLARPKLNRD